MLLRCAPQEQLKQLREVIERLLEFRELVKEVIRSACRTSLLEAGFTPDDYFIDLADAARLGSGAPMRDARTHTTVQYTMHTCCFSLLLC